MLSCWQNAAVRIEEVSGGKDAAGEVEQADRGPHS